MELKLKIVIIINFLYILEITIKKDKIQFLLK